MKVAFWGNTQKEVFWELLPELTSWLQEKGQEVFFTTHIHKRLEDKSKFNYSIIEKADDFKNVDFVLAMGGDGTILSAARGVEHRGTPIFGVHLGGLGFLAEGTVENMYTRLESIIAGNYTTFPRILVEAVIEGDNNTTVTALNDLVIDAGEGFRLMKCSLFSERHFITSYSADGLIVATPTGSTAYNLAAGGPIVTPWLSLFTVTPICPHTLSSRPIVLPAENDLTITFPEEEPGARLTVDGQLEYSVPANGRVVIRKADYEVNMITFEDRDYFQTLRTKMGWGQHNGGVNPG